MTLIIRRREFVRLSILAGLGGLIGCNSNFATPTLLTSKGIIPKSLLNTLPYPWRFDVIKKSYNGRPFSDRIKKGIDLLAIEDGWLQELPAENLQPINFDKFKSKLDIQALKFISGLNQNLIEKVFPIGVSPWVMVFRNGDEWISDAMLNWEILLDSSLNGQIILPRSPRLVISIAQSMNEPNALKRLRSQVRIFDDKNALNWLMNGDARVAVLPLNRCLRNLKIDPRLNIVLPNIGSPLNWTVLLRPINTKEPWPQSWLENYIKMPLLGKLLADGWLPSIEHSLLRDSAQSLSFKYRSIVLPPKQTWERCWSLYPLKEEDQKSLKAIWSSSIP